jgi:hypothetical protein
MPEVGPPAACQTPWRLGEVLQILQDLPEEEYGNMADVMRGYGEARAEPGEARTRVESHTRHEEDGR